jgi:hypothetical protein
LAGFIFLGGLDSDTIQPNTISTVATPFTFGLGKVKITVTADDLVEKRSAFILGPFFLWVKEI